MKEIRFSTKKYIVRLGVIHMSDKSKNNIGLLNAEIPECVDKALTNLTEQPTKVIGSTISDIWFLVFGGIGHSAEKRKLRYAVELENYNRELHEKIDAIPNEKRVEPDIQIVAPALEASKYCVEKEELRKMFVNLIASSINSDKVVDVHPIFTDIIGKLSSTDAKLFRSIAKGNYDEDCVIFGASIKSISFSLTILEQLGLILSKNKNGNGADELKKNIITNDIRLFKCVIENFTIMNFAFDILYENIYDMITKYLFKENLSGTTFPRHKSVISFFVDTIELTKLGRQFKDICL